MSLNKFLGKVGVLVILALPFAASSSVIVIDDLDAGFSSQGFVQSIHTGTSRPSIGGTYMVDQPGSQGDYAIWDPTNDLGWLAGIWKVEMNWTSWSNRTTAALVTIGTGFETLFINQTSNGGSWQNLGNFDFSTINSFVKIDDSNSANGKYVIADAVRFTFVSAAAPNPNAVSAPTTLVLSALSLLGFGIIRRKKK